MYVDDEDIHRQWMDNQWWMKVNWWMRTKWWVRVKWWMRAKGRMRVKGRRRNEQLYTINIRPVLPRQNSPRWPCRVHNIPLTNGRGNALWCWTRPTQPSTHNDRCAQFQTALIHQAIAENSIESRTGHWEKKTLALCNIDQKSPPSPSISEW